MSLRRSGEAGDAVPGIPSCIVAFLELYEAGEYWESHEVLEGPWRASGSPFYQALILYASAWVHWQRGNAHGVVAQLRKTLGRLEGVSGSYLGFDVHAIRAHCSSVIAVVESGGAWSDAVAPMPLDVSRERFRGDEAELVDPVS